MNKTYDVIVIGLGGMGSAAVYHLAARGKRVLGLDRNAAVHDLGSSHGGSRIIRQAYHEDVHYVPLVQRSYELWRQLEQDSGADLLRITGGLLLGSLDSSVVSGSLLSAREHGLSHELLGPADLRRRFPVLKPRETDHAVFETNAGFVRPEAAVRAHLESAERLGADLHFEEPMVRWHVHASGAVQVITNVAKYEADRVVFAPGAWAPEILSGLGVSLQVRRHVMCWFQPTDRFEAFLPESFPVYVWQVDADRIFYGFPAIDGPTGGVKAAIHSGGEACTPESIRRAVLEKDVEEIREYLGEYIPSLNGPMNRASVCMYTLTPDENFVVAAHPVFPQISVACGFSGHGFKFTPVIGEILADLATHGSTQHPIEFLGPDRFEKASTRP